MKILLVDDFGSAKELTVDALTMFAASEHAVECVNCHKWRLDEHAIQDDPGWLWFCGPECFEEHRQLKRQGLGG